VGGEWHEGLRTERETVSEEVFRGRKACHEESKWAEGGRKCLRKKYLTGRRVSD
jgi:hypothetical protein